LSDELWFVGSSPLALGQIKVPDKLKFAEHFFSTPSVSFSSAPVITFRDLLENANCIKRADIFAVRSSARLPICQTQLLRSFRLFCVNAHRRTVGVFDSR